MKYFFSLLFLIFSLVNYAQSIIPNEYLVQLEDKKIRRTLAQDLSAQGIEFEKFKLIYPSLNIYHIVVKNDNGQEPLDLDLLRNHSAISHINYNHGLTLRAEPNDPSFSDQWSFDRVNAPEAWEFATGGVNYKGDDIVIAILDDGFDPSHEDLNGNLWVNKDEIADGIDNDGNGYIDDINGVNVSTSNGTHKSRSHGTKVCGIIGAEGNNDKGLAGINWKVKMMLISGQDDPYSQANVVEAYSYAKEARKRYNETDGAEGAFVVATNSSWGIDDQQAVNFPIWCEIYDDMGSEGIISVAATNNSSKDVSILGDMPGTCTSEYLIVVTNTDQSNTVIGGYSLEHIDLAAPGDDLISTGPGNDYSSFGGTSGACPHVTGAVGLIYSMPCSVIKEEEIKDKPGAVALQIKSIILDNVFSIPDMNQKSTTGGMLDLEASLQALNDSESESSTGFAVCGYSPNPTRYIGVFDYNYPLDSDHTLSLFDMTGKLIYQEEIKGSGNNNQVEINLTNYPSGTYILRLKDDNFKRSFKISKI